jgi:hypothetical protein
LFILTSVFVGHELSKIWIDDVVVMKCGQARAIARAFVVLLMERRSIIVFNIAHVLMLGMVAFVTRRTWPST